MVKWVRTKGPRRRGSLHTLVRSVPRIGQRIPPVPWIGAIARHLYPTEIADYESLATGSWTVANFKPVWNWPANTFTGNNWECYYHVLAVPDEQTSDVEVILPPLRFAVEEATASGGDFDYWENNPIGQPNAEQYDVGGPSPSAPTPKRGLSPLCSNTLLPVSGNSHVSDGKPTSLEFYFSTNCMFYHAFKLLGGWNPISFLTPFAQPRNFECSPAYFRIRINGTAVGSLIDYRSHVDWQGDQNDSALALVDSLEGRISRSPIIFPSAPASSTGEPRESWELDFVAGDELEIDVWFRLRARPLFDRSGRNRSGTGAKSVICVIARHDTVTNSRIYNGPGVSVTGGYGHSTYAQAVLTGLKISDGFDPDADTYTFEAVGGTGNFGDGSAGAHKAEAGDGWAAPVITSRQLTWGYNSSGGSPPTGPPGNADWLGDAGGSGSWTLVNNFCNIGFIPEEPPFPSTALQTNNRNCVADVPATPWDDVTQMSVVLDWQLEICVLRVTITRTGVGTITWYFRPQNSSDYITEVTDRTQGDLTCGPCGVFNHLGTTTFIPWYGTQEDPYTPPSDADMPTSIIVTKVAQ